MKDNLEPSLGIYLCGKQPYIIIKNKKGKLKVYNQNGPISANPYLFRFEDPLTKQEIKKFPQELLGILENTIEKAFADLPKEQKYPKTKIT